MADVDGDGIEERLTLTGEHMEDGFCLTPLLTVYEGDWPIAIQPIFERMGYVRPYFGDAVDFDGDGRMDFHVMYEARNIAEEKSFMVLTVLDNTIMSQSPLDAYLAALYEVPMNISTSDYIPYYDAEHNNGEYDRRYERLIEAMEMLTEYDAPAAQATPTAAPDENLYPDGDMGPDAIPVVLEGAGPNASYQHSLRGAHGH